MALGGGDVEDVVAPIRISLGIESRIWSMELFVHQNRIVINKRNVAYSECG